MANETAIVSFTTSVIESVAASAKVPTSQVEILGVFMGSVVIKVKVDYRADDLSQARPDEAFQALLEQPGGISHIFGESPLLADYSDSAEIHELNSLVIANTVDEANTATTTTTIVVSGVASTTIVTETNSTVSTLVIAPTMAPEDAECSSAAGTTAGCDAAEESASCADENNGGCDPLTQCIDAEDGPTCGACPWGFYGEGDVHCIDVDECAMTPPCDPLTKCQNREGSFACSPCPLGYRGSGATGCVELSGDITCAEHNGGCDPLTNCTDLALETGASTSCGGCPEGYIGSGDTICVDLDACLPESCASGVECLDTPAPGVGYTCGACPPGFAGNGASCFVDLCAAAAPCDPLVSCTPTLAGYTCGACPSGYIGHGAQCLDIDECAGALRGGCDPNVRCVNKPGGFECGPCPEGMIGSGSTRCLQSTRCSLDNGGCDALTTCTDTTGGISECGLCPTGYTGTGATGCVDEDGCAAAGALGRCYGVCLDVRAPGTGYTCAPCPPDMVGDGHTCVTNLCYTENGGCDIAVTCTMDEESGTRACGACPSGQEMALDLSVSSGFRCAEVDGCLREPCWREGLFAQLCVDVPAPGSGRECGACPAGFVAAEEGGGCADVDECALSPNGGCWVSESNVELQAPCANILGGFVCGECPSGYIGTGETECRERVLCNTNHGGCDPLVACTDNDVTGYADCGPCPAGYAGTGDTACVDADGCALEPCFPGVECADVAAPGEGRVCGSCPEGFLGDGGLCEQCTLLLTLDLHMTSVMGGTMKRAATNQLAGAFSGTNDPGCVVTQGVSYWWDGVASDGTLVPLDSTINMRETLTLYLPRHTLTANVVYNMQLTVNLRGNPRVRSTVDISFMVEWQPLVALIRGGRVVTGEGLPVLLDARDSYDPDNLPGEMTFDWTCTRVDAAAPERYCRGRSGELLPLRITSAAINLTLLGSEPGAEYTLECQVAKASRRSVAASWVIIELGSPPVPSIVPLTSKHIPSEILRLRSQVTSLRSDPVSMSWRVDSGKDTPDLDLSVTASIVLDLPDLVIAPNSLQPGGRYWFTLVAEDANGWASVTMEVEVNQPPYAGHFTVQPLNGTISETVFDVESYGWLDNPEDFPLWYQLRYDIIGVKGETTWWTAWQPSPIFAKEMTAAGLEQFDYAVTVRLVVRDLLGALAEVVTNLTVYPKVFASEAAQLLYVDAAIENASQQVLRYGIDSSPTVVTIASIFNDLNGLTSSLQLEEGAQMVGFNVSTPRRQAQRGQMMGVLDEVWTRLPPTTDSVTRMAQNAAKVAADPKELDRSTGRHFRAIASSLVNSTINGNEDARLDIQGATALVHGLSSVSVSALGAADQAAEVGACVEVVLQIGLSNAQEMVPEEDPVAIASPLLSSLAVRLDLSSNKSRAYTAPIQTPSGATVQMHRSLGGALEEHCDPRSVDLLVVSSAVDPYAVPGTAREVDVAVSNMTSISLHESNHNELPVHDLKEALTFTLPIHLPANRTAQVLPDDDDPRSKARLRREAAAARAVETVAPFAGSECRFWDEARGGYSAEGCTTLPNPRPPRTRVYWRTVNASELATLEAAWGLLNEGGAANLSITAGCEEVWGAAYPEYYGLDAGKRKYVGESCQLADKENEAGCWWEWRIRAFQGPGCAWTAETSCLCTHLTDFAAVQRTELGSPETPPESVGVYTTGDMTGVTWEEFVASTALMGVLAVLTVGALLICVVSDHSHGKQRMRLMAKLVDAREGSVFRDIGGLWTWTIVDPGEYAGALAMKHNKKKRATSALATCFSTMVRENKLRKGMVSQKFLTRWKRAASGETVRRAGIGRLFDTVGKLWQQRTGFLNSDKAAASKGTPGGGMTPSTTSVNVMHMDMDSLSVVLAPPPSTLLEASVFKKLRMAARERQAHGTISGSEAISSMSAPLGPAAKVSADEPMAAETATNHSEAPSQVVTPQPHSAAIDVSEPEPVGAKDSRPLSSGSSPSHTGTKLGPTKPGRLKPLRFTAHLAARRTVLPSTSAEGGAACHEPAPVQALHKVPRVHQQDHHAQATGRMLHFARRTMALQRSDLTPSTDALPPQVAGLQLPAASAGAAVHGNVVPAPNPLSPAYSGAAHYSPALQRKLHGVDSKSGGPVMEETMQFDGSASREGALSSLWRVDGLWRSVDRGMRAMIGGMPRRRSRQRGQVRRELGTASREKEVMNARELFRTLNIDITRLQLCLPMDHLEACAIRQARHEPTLHGHKSSRTQRNGRRRYLGGRALKNLKGQPDTADLDMDAEVEEGSSEHRLGHEIDSCRYMGMPPFSAGAREGCSGEGGVAGPVTEGLRAFHAAQRGNTAGPAAQSQWVTSCEGLAMVNALQTRDEASRSRAQALWQKVQMRERELTIERLLGTAMVHAFCGIKSLLSKRDLEQQAVLAAAVPWKLPNERPFNWWVSVCKVLIGNMMEPAGCSARSCGTDLSAARSAAAEISEALATVLKAGPPTEGPSRPTLCPHTARSQLTVPAACAARGDAVQHGEGGRRRRIPGALGHNLVLETLERPPHVGLRTRGWRAATRWAFNRAISLCRSPCQRPCGAKRPALEEPASPQRHSIGTIPGCHFSAAADGCCARGAALAAG
ncbi:hypothetical protein CYMTET_32952 [Cymbomonas tetramitiformis]|uniref:GPS domain-containing protein n=1 Tax=Cymbomonas tetramitiformis TaxID=36881 RepID=A0AAE0FE06_9CHLO|nr:hypothetical protein CYMTET_32952 [Cymbomonas tetramitiformis]